MLSSIEQGDPKAAEELLPLVYEELRKLAAHKMAQPVIYLVEKPQHQQTKPGCLSPGQEKERKI